MKIILTHEQRTQLIEELTRGETEIEIVAPGGPVDFEGMFNEISLWLNDGVLQFHTHAHAKRVCNALAQNARGGRFGSLSFDTFAHFIKGASFRNSLRNVGPTAPAVLGELLAIDGVKRIVEKYTG